MSRSRSPYWVVAALLCMWLLSSFSFHQSAAQGSNDTFTFQARITQGGVPVDGTLDLTFEIHDSLTSTTPVNGWTETLTVNVAKGIVSARLGDTTSLATVFPSAGTVDRFIAIKNAAGAEIVVPRVKISAVPYALTAGAADSVGGQTLTDLNNRFVLKPSPPASGTFQPGTLLFVDGSGSIQRLDPPPASAVDQVLKFDPTSGRPNWGDAPAAPSTSSMKTALVRFDNVEGELIVPTPGFTAKALILSGFSHPVNMTGAAIAPLVPGTSIYQQSSYGHVPGTSFTTTFTGNTIVTNVIPFISGGGQRVVTSVAVGQVKISANATFPFTGWVLAIGD